MDFGEGAEVVATVGVFGDPVLEFVDGEDGAATLGVVGDDAGVGVGGVGGAGGALDVGIDVGGGEYNVAANLSDCFGLKTGIASAKPVRFIIAGSGRLVRVAAPSPARCRRDGQGHRPQAAG